MKNVERRGCVVTLVDTPVGEVSGIATIREMGAYVDIAEIAELMAYSKLLRLLMRKG